MNMTVFPKLLTANKDKKEFAILTPYETRKLNKLGISGSKFAVLNNDLYRPNSVSGWDKVGNIRVY